MGKRRSVIPLCPVPCREDQFNEILQLVQQNIIDNGSKCLYVSGVPGTGKTLIVSTVLEELEKNSDTPNFNNVYINGLSLGTNPDKIWKVLWEHISQDKLSSKRALAKLETHFSTLDIIPTVLVIDELDQLMDKRQAVLYQLLEWTTNPDTKLTFIGIFNTMNLPENLVNRNASRMGLSRVQFPPYDASQLQTIVESWLKKSKRSKIELNADALGLLSKKVAAVSGDARRALQIAKRTVEKMEDSGVKGVHAVNSAFQELFTTPKVETIRHCSTLEKCILEGVVSEVKRSGDEEINFGRVESDVVAQNQYEGKFWSRDNITAALMRLISLRLLSLESSDILITASSKISLNVASEDVKYALDKERDK